MECLEKGKTMLYGFGDEPTNSDYTARQILHLDHSPRQREIQDSSYLLGIGFDSSLRDDEVEKLARGYPEGTLERI